MVSANHYEGHICPLLIPDRFNPVVSRVGTVGVVGSTPAGYACQH